MSGRPLVLVVCSDDKETLCPASIRFVQKSIEKGVKVVVYKSDAIHSQCTSLSIQHDHEQGELKLENDPHALVAIPPKANNGVWSSDVHNLVRSYAFKYNEVALVTNPSVQLSLDFAKSSDIRKEFAQAAFKVLSEMDATLSQNLDLSCNNVVLVVGGGGREHAIAWKLASSNSVARVYVAPGNGGTSSSKISNVPSISVSDSTSLVSFAKSNNVTLCVVGPEAPLIDGLADIMNAAGIPTFGPSAAAAELEASKAFSKDFMARHGVPTAAYQNFTSFDDALAYVSSVDYDVVVKASGIAAGKGVILPTSTEEAISAVTDVMVNKAFGTAGDEVVIEECLVGEEVSVLCFCDGQTVVPMPPAQDHKRIFDRDDGPNTGGMGAYAPAPALTPEMEIKTTEIVKKVVAAMAAEGRPYVGVLYAGFMLTPKYGPVVLEFNCRFGDPETQVLLPLLDSDFYKILSSCVSGTLRESDVCWKDQACTTVVAASGGYPGSYQKGKVISGIDDANTVPGVITFHAGTSKSDSNSVVTSGGRVLAVSALGSDLQEAISRSYDGISRIAFDGMQYRRDIALKGLLATAGPLRVGVLGSTRGSSLQPILDAIEARLLPNVSVDVVISNKNVAGSILDKARSHGINAVHVSPKDKSREEFDEEVTSVFEEAKVDLILCIGYMRILSTSFCQRWKNRVLNVHPSLLPEFAGGMDLTVHQAVIDAKKCVSGCTTHFVTEVVDGGPIAVQISCPVLPTDTAETLKSRVQPLEGQAFLHSIRMFQAKRIGNPSCKMITYADAGVSIDAGNDLVDKIKPYCKSTRRVGCDSDLGGFGGLFDLTAAGYKSDTILVACTDGVGTKLKVAQLANKHDTVGIDLVAMCVNDLIVQGAEPLFFLDYYACGKLEVEAAADVVKGIASGCVDSNCGLIGGETAEMPSMYSEGDYDLAGFCIGAVRKSDILPLPVTTGNVVLGLASSGIHSNGYSLVRKLVETHKLSYDDSCPFDPTVSLGEKLLTPTRLYVKQLLPILKQKLIIALAHITGGGLLENIPRIFKETDAVELNCDAWTLPPVFKWLKNLGNLSDSEMARTFNCGIGMVLIVSEENVGSVSSLLKDVGEEVFVMGKVIERKTATSPQVVLSGSLQI